MVGLGTQELGARPNGLGPEPRPDAAERWSALGLLKTWSIILSVSLVALAMAVQYFLFDGHLTRGWSALATAALLIIGVAVFSAAIWRLLERVERRLRAAYAGERAQRRQAEGLAAASVDIVTELDMDAVAQKIVDRSREVTGARYGALGVLGPNDQVEAFYASGIDAEARARLGPPPSGHGLLGLVSERRQPLVVDDIARHPAAVGFPPHHPPMRTLLAVPVWLRDEVIGNLYVSDKENGEGFSAEDTLALQRFAAQAAVAIQNARLHRQLQELSIVAERERIAMDLHDGLIQSLFGVRLQMEAITVGLPEGDATREALGEAIERMGNVMADVRHYVFDLRAQLEAGEALPALLQHLLESLQAGPVFASELRVQGTPWDVSREVQWELWHICREALTNAVRHSQGHHLGITLAFDETALALEVADDGCGWSGAPAPDGHHGLENMQRRAERIGGRLQIDTAPGRGTRVRVTVPTAVAGLGDGGR